jgi:hypothetical protein
MTSSSASTRRATAEGTSRHGIGTHTVRQGITSVALGA